MTHVSLLALGLLAVDLAACSQGADGGGAEEGSVSVAASPIVQAAGVQRIKSHVVEKVTTVDLLDAGGKSIGTLVLTTDGAERVHAIQTWQGHSLDATWSADQLSFSRDGGDVVTLHAGARPPASVDDALRNASDALNVATYVAADVGVYSPMPATARASSLRALTLTSGQDDKDKFTGTASTWWNTQSAFNNAYYGSQNNAYNMCSNVSSYCATYQGATMTTSCVQGTYTGYTCTTTITPGHP